MSRPPLLYTLSKAALAAPMRLAYRVDAEGVDHVPTEGPAILAANHRSFMDSVFLALTSPRPISFLAKAEYFDNKATRWLFRGTGQIPVRRGSPSGAREAVEAASEVLADGGVIGVYPEGTRSRDGHLHRGHLGPARLALASGAPLVPIGLLGTENVQRPNERLPRPFRRVGVRFGPPLGVRSQPNTTDREQLLATTDSLMENIAALTGQPVPPRTSTDPPRLDDAATP